MNYLEARVVLFVRAFRITLDGSVGSDVVFMLAALSISSYTRLPLRYWNSGGVALTGVLW
jgi:hypothetical protein